MFVNQIGEVSDAEAWKGDLQGCFNALSQIHCGICGLPGHKKAQCWLNGAVYEWCRANDKAGVNYSWRAYIKLKARI